jgi:hypothetical protein
MTVIRSLLLKRGRERSHRICRHSIHKRYVFSGKAIQVRLE